MLRRSSSDPRDRTAYLVCACADRSLADPVQVAGMRGTVEESRQTAAYERRLMREANVDRMHTKCGWRHVPAQLPPWQTVYSHLRQWRKTGIGEHRGAGLDQPHPPDELQL